MVNPIFIMYNPIYSDVIMYSYVYSNVFMYNYVYSDVFMYNYCLYTNVRWKMLIL